MNLWRIQFDKEEEMQGLIINIHLQAERPERRELDGYIYICLSPKEISLMVFRTVTKLSPSGSESLGDMWRYFNQQQSMGQMQRTSETDIQKQPPTAFVLPPSKTELIFIGRNKKSGVAFIFYLTNTSFENFLISAAGKSHSHCYQAQCGGRGTTKNVQKQKERQQQPREMWFMMWETHTYFILFGRCLCLLDIAFISGRKLPFLKRAEGQIY